MLKREVIIIIVALILIVISFIWGFQLGVKQTISWGVRVASHFANITIDQQELSNAILQYKSYIGVF
jgi:hypothetical protein